MKGNERKVKGGKVHVNMQRHAIMAEHAAVDPTQNNTVSREDSHFRSYTLNGHLFPQLGSIF